VAKPGVGPRLKNRPWAAACLIAAASALAVLGQADFTAPPRYDGAGYAVLARSLRQGSGYRAIDHPDRPRHVHFPPGYPAVLALWWSVTGESPAAAHALSCLCSVSATLAAWLWFRRIYPPQVALALGLALAVNWAWSRTGSAIQSEPLYELLCQAAILTAVGTRASSGSARAIVLGALLASCLLARHIALGLLVAVLADLWLRRRRRSAWVALLTALALVAPWLAWLVAVRGEQRTQADLLAAGGSDLWARFLAQGLFYLQRIPDQIAGPLVEYATVVRRGGSWQTAANLGAVFASVLVLTGWSRAVRRRSRRLGGSIPILTLTLLLIWPYTEAGRFLVPLVPCLLIGAVEGASWLLGAIIRRAGWTPWPGRLRLVAALAILAISLPYTSYSLITGRGRRPDPANQAFDAACAWLRREGARPGPVLTRHPGEVFLATGRPALDVPTAERPGDTDAGPAEVAVVIDRYQVAYLLIDEDRYLQAHPSPLGRFVRAHPDRVRRVGSWEAGRSSVVLDEVVPRP
jgi:hypothetical protein